MMDLRSLSRLSLPLVHRHAVVLLVLTGLLLGATGGGWLPNAPMGAMAVAAVNKETATGGQFVLSVDELAPDQGGVTLKTVRTERVFHFSKPTNWNVQPTSAITVKFQHSASLLPERSALNVKVNNRILKTIPLTKANVNGATVTVPVPPAILKDRNTVAFQVDQHYTYDCEDPFSEELWTTVLPESALRLDYQFAPFKPELAQFPFPFFNPLLDGVSTVGFVAPNTLSAESQTALATVASTVGNAASWHPLDVQLLDAQTMSRSNRDFVLVGTPAENSTIAQLAANSPLRVSGSGFSAPAGAAALGGDDGVLLLVPHPTFKHRGVLIVSGNSPLGVQKAARFLAANPASKLMSGQYTVVQGYEPQQQDLARQWQGYVQSNTPVSFEQLGLNTQTTRGFAAPTLHYMLRRMPDLYMNAGSKVRLTTQYSYASQLDVEQSTLEVRLNGKSVASVPLDKVEGETNASLAVDIPAEDFFTYNDLEYQFFLYPEKFDKCRFVTDAHIWGTVHNTSVVDVPARVQAALPDVGLINDGGFPFSLVPDLSEVTFVLSSTPTPAEQDTLLQMATRFGQVAPSTASKAPSVVMASQLDGSDAAKNDHLIVIGQTALQELGDKVSSKYQLVVENRTAELSEREQALTRISHNPNQGILEERLSPFNKNRVVLLAYGETEQAQREVANAFKRESVFSSIQEGNIAVIQNGQVQSLIALKEGEARLMNQQGQQQQGGGFTANWPGWANWVLWILAALGVLALLKVLFGRR